MTDLEERVLARYPRDVQWAFVAIVAVAALLAVAVVLAVAL